MCLWVDFLFAKLFNISTIFFGYSWIGCLHFSPLFDVRCFWAVFGKVCTLSLFTIESFDVASVFWLPFVANLIVFGDNSLKFSANVYHILNIFFIVLLFRNWALSTSYWDRKIAMNCFKPRLLNSKKPIIFYLNFFFFLIFNWSFKFSFLKKKLIFLFLLRVSFLVVLKIYVFDTF